jgi:hypothetical protein
VSAEQAPPLDRAVLLAAFVEHGAQFVIVGGIAAQVYGATRVTKDLDLCPAWSADNLERVAAALRDLGARMKIGEGSIELLEVALDAKTLANMEIVPWRTRAGDIDVLLGIPNISRFELARYEQLVATATIIEVDGLEVAVASLADIIRSKEIADRPKDREALNELRAIDRLHRERATSHEPPDLGFDL